MIEDVIIAKGYKILLAKLFGKKIVCVEDDFILIFYFWRGVYYVTDLEVRG